MSLNDLMKPLLNCNSKPCAMKKGAQKVSKCLCQLVWAKGSEASNNAYCKRLSSTERADITALSAMALKNKLPNIHPKKMAPLHKLMMKTYKNMTEALQAPIDGKNANFLNAIYCFQ